MKKQNIYFLLRNKRDQDSLVRRNDSLAQEVKNLKTEKDALAKDVKELRTTVLKRGQQVQSERQEAQVTRQQLTVVQDELAVVSGELRQSHYVNKAVNMRAGELRSTQDIKSEELITRTAQAEQDSKQTAINHSLWTLVA